MATKTTSNTKASQASSDADSTDPNAPEGGPNFLFGVLILVAGMVSGWMSFLGARAVFGNGFTETLTALGFAVIVQGTVALSLWLLPNRTTTRQAMLTGIWAVAVSFSISSAYLMVSENSAGTAARDEFKTYLTDVQAKLDQLELKASELHQVAQHEYDHGGTNDDDTLRAAGDGPVYRKKLAAANAAEDKAESYQKIADPVLNEANARLEDMPESAGVGSYARLFEEIAPQFGHVAKGVEAPRLIDNQTATQRVSNGLVGLGNGDTDAWVSFGMASLMEVLALLLALARMVMLAPDDPRSPIARAHAALAGLLEFRYLHQRAETTAANNQELNEVKAAVHHQENMKPYQRVWGKGTKSAKPNDQPLASGRGANEIKNPEGIWRAAIQCMAAHEEKSVVEVVHHEMMRDAALLDATSSGHVDSPFLKEHPALVSALKRTKVITNKEGRFAFGEARDRWVQFLFNESARLGEHNARAEATQARGRLKAVSA